MQYSDDDVSVSGSEEDHQHEGVSEDDYNDDDEAVSFSEDSEDEAAEPAAAAAAAAAAGAGLAAAGKASTRDVTDALVTGEMSTQTALLQMEVNAKGMPLSTPSVVANICCICLSSRKVGVPAAAALSQSQCVSAGAHASHP